MPKAKPPKLDMNPMADLAFLLVTFFLLATQIRADEPVIIDQPASNSENKLPDKNLLKILVSEDGKLYFGISGKKDRQELIKRIEQDYNMEFSENQINSFALVNSFGVPIQNLPEFLNKPATVRKGNTQPGIPFDSTRNELLVWIQHAKSVNENLQIAIKGDQDVKYPSIKKVMDMLVARDITNIHLITELDNGRKS